MKSRVLSALTRGGSVASVARTAMVDPELVRIAIDHRERLGLVDDRCRSACAALDEKAAVPVGCRGCPLIAVRRM
ncbi:hypothetical protein EJO69_06790 [Flaviflexus salsibiostraticola]|uniref:Uncharacterized protein n=1 Tax=Flaviflexus salsibiostraticola TaxID=1282737 RepID=A0A3Q8WTP5_9ACTO|nr:hypothetical protein [Flaviflexus salsibiostraticola]AZN30047.1 hypothetical protein EJO69_06790 [Flaviflexus salsibiostraticola]